LGGPVWCPDSIGALRFEGLTNQVVGKTDGFPDITNNFTMPIWVYPTAGRQAVPESVEGTVGIAGQRYAIWPASYYGSPGHVGAGLSVGTNGISVFEHTGNYMPALASYDAVLTNWTHVAVVYTNRQPRIWVNGVLVRTGLVSRMIVHPGDTLGDSFGYGCFAGMLRDARIYNRALSDKEIQAMGILIELGRR
jgi:hypothetical protein